MEAGYWRPFVTGDEYTNLEKAIIRKILPWLVVGGVAVGGVGGSGVLRVDKFTGNDARLMKQELEFEMRLMEQDIREDMPPESTRKRIRAIERCLERNCTDFEVKEYHW